MLLKDLLAERSMLQKVAVVDGEIELTYAELMSRADRCREVIHSVSKERAHISIFMPNSASYVTAYCAILSAGCVVVPLYHKSTKQEIERAVDACDVQILLTNSEYISKLDEVVFARSLTVIDIDSLSIKVYGADKDTALPHSTKNVAVTLGTSGSTSDPKRVMLSDENLLENAKSIIHSLQYTEDERILAVLPLTFASGNTSQLIVSLLLSATLYIYHGIIHPKFFFSAIHKYGITSTTIVPSILKILMADGTDHTKECENLRVICFGGGPTDLKTIEQIKNSKLRDKFVHMYGQTEGSTRISHLHLNTELDKLPSVGKPLFNIDVKVDVSETDGKSGEILVSGPNVMLGYYKEQKSPIQDGWLHTGDIGYMDEEGYLYITGRIKNIIICSGMNIQVEEVEDILFQHPFIKDAVVFGIPDEQHGEPPVANVVLQDNAVLSEDELRTYCKSKLSDFKIPARIHIVKELDRTYNGKVSRNIAERNN